MKIRIIFMMACSQIMALEIPDDIKEGISTSSLSESGGIYIRGVEEKKFLEYICTNWRGLMENIEGIPKARGGFTSEQSAINAAVSRVGAACEWLSPLEYVDFLEKFIELGEEGKIHYGPIKNQLMGSAKKMCFLEVNHSNSRVKSLLDRAVKIIPPEDKSMLAYLKSVRSGDLEDMYLENMPDDFRPETMPGVKLKRPWGSVIMAYENLTGRVEPPDPEFEEQTPRASRREANPIFDAESREGFDESSPVVSVGWLMAGGAFVLLGLKVLLKRRK